MKKLYLLSILFIVSCASVTGGFPKDTNETSIDRATRCYYENIKEYWGNCWIEESKEEPTFEEWVEYLEMEKSWTMLQELNDKLIIGLEANATNIPEANRIFGIAVTDIDAIVNAKIQFNAREAELRRQQIGMALLAMSASINQANQNYYNSQSNNLDSFEPIEPIKTNYILSSQYVSGRNRVCIYKLGSTTATHTVANYGACPSVMGF